MAEVLITLGIIGVVAAMTMPSLINNIQYKQFKAKAKKAYSVAGQVIEQMRNDDYEFPVSFSSSVHDAASATKFASDWNNLNSSLGSFMSEFETHFSGTTACSNFSLSNYKYLNGNKSSGNIITISSTSSLATQCFSTTDGITFLAGIETPSGMGGGTYRARMLTDVNGYKNIPNTFGRDAFLFEISDGKLKPYSSGTCSKTGDGLNCMEYILLNKNY